VPGDRSRRRLEAEADIWGVSTDEVRRTRARQGRGNGAGEPTKTSPAFVTADELIAEPRPVEIIEGVAWAGAVTVLVAASGAGKTFLLLDAAAAVSDAVRWHGRSVRPGSVAFLSFEGDSLGVRLRALREAKGHRLENVFLMRASDPLSPRVGRDGAEELSIGECDATQALLALAASLSAEGKPPITLVIVDTVRASLSGSEDSSEHVSAYLRAIRRMLAKLPGAAGILAHHAGWIEGDSSRRRERGSSAWRGNCDGTLFLDASGEDRARRETRLTLSALKVRDAELPAPLHLVRRSIDLLEQDERGEPATSCVIERDARTREERRMEAEIAADAAARDLDLRPLKAIADRPEVATSQEGIRIIVGAQRNAVSASVQRLVRDGWAIPGGRGKPYQITAEGRRRLEESGP